VPPGGHTRGRALPALPAPLANAPGQCNAGVPAGSVLARFAAAVSFLTANKFHVVGGSPPYPNLWCAAPRLARLRTRAMRRRKSARSVLREQGAAADRRAEAADAGPEQTDAEIACGAASTRLGPARSGPARSRRAQVLADERARGDAGAAADPAQWISNWTSLLSTVSADPAAAPRVHVELLDSPDAYGLQCGPPHRTAAPEWPRGQARACQLPACMLITT
jgi:hypothetical protein